MALRMKVILVIIMAKVSIPSKCGTMVLPIPRRLYMSSNWMSRQKTISIGMMISVSMKNAEETAMRVLLSSPWATYSATVFRKPFPKPISMKSIQIRMPLMVSHTPLL